MKKIKKTPEKEIGKTLKKDEVLLLPEIIIAENLADDKFINKFINKFIQYLQKIKVTTSFLPLGDFKKTLGGLGNDKIIILESNSETEIKDIIKLYKKGQVVKKPIIVILTEIKEIEFSDGIYIINKFLEYDIFFNLIDNLLQIIKSRSELAKLDILIETKEKVLSRYLTKDLVDLLLHEEDTSIANGMNVRGTFMFFDLRNSTGIAEALEPKFFKDFLNEIFTDVMDLIYENNGFVNKMIGDGILATFGCPVQSGSDETNAVRCALSIREYFKMFNDVLPGYLSDPVKYGIGIASGQVFAGFIGSVRKREYTVLGNAVNTASRIEAMTKESGKDILIDEETQKKANKFIHSELIGENRIAGKEKTVKIYHLLSMKDA